MSNSEKEKRICELIDITRNGYLKYTDDEILLIYEEICGIVYRNEGNYTEKQRQKLKTEAWLESLAIVQDGILFKRKEGKYSENK